MESADAAPLVRTTNNRACIEPRRVLDDDAPINQPPPILLMNLGQLRRNLYFVRFSLIAMQRIQLVLGEQRLLR